MLVAMSELPAPTGARDPWPTLVTNSALPDEHYVREAAILGLAMDCVLGRDSFEAENAIAWSRRLMDEYEHSEHDGDCTKQAHTCSRCLCDEALSQAREEFGG
jgi:hypothetical protein